MTTQKWIVAGVFFYMLILVGIGYWASRKVKNTKDFIVAGGQIGGLLSFGSIFATWFGAETCMGASATAPFIPSLFPVNLTVWIRSPWGTARLCQGVEAEQKGTDPPDGPQMQPASDRVPG